MSDEETNEDSSQCEDCSEDTPNKEYFEAIQKYYNERLKSQLKPKFRKCDGCKEDKQFIDKQGQLLYSCGSTSGKCGSQMVITLTKYCYYPEMKEDVTKILNSLVDLSQFKEVFTKQEINERNELRKDNETLLNKCKKPFSKQNQMKARENLIKKTHRNRIQLKKDQTILLSRIKEEDDKDRKQVLMKEYIQINQRIKEEYEELYKWVMSKSLNMRNALLALIN